VDLRRRYAEARGSITVDDKVGFQPLLLLVGIDVTHDRTIFQGLYEFRRPGEKIVGAVGLQRVLIGRIALPAAGADVLHRIEEQPSAWDLRELGTQPRDDRVNR